MRRLQLATLALLVFSGASSTLALAQDTVALSVARAYASTDEASGLPAINIVLTRDGQAAFAAFTAEHAGKRTDMLVDGVVVTSPVIQTEIDSKWLVLTGDFSTEEVQTMADWLNEASSSVGVRVQGKQKSK